MPRVEFHAYFASQFEALCGDGDQLEIAGEIAALLDALERHGHDIEHTLVPDWERSHHTHHAQVRRTR